MARATIIAALIGAIGVIVAALIGIQFGESQGTQQAQATATIQQATDVAAIAQQPTQTPIEVTRIVEATKLVEATRIVEITPVPGPTQTPVIIIVTPTTAPTATPPEITAPNSILAPGEAWKQGDVSFTLLDDYQFTSNKLIVNWIFANNTGGQLTVSYGNDNFTARDSSDNLLSNRGFWDGGDFICPETTKILNTGETLKNTGCNYPLRFDFDPTRCSEEIIITVSNISRIERARWRVPAPPC